MTYLPVITHPHKVLHTPAQKVTHFDTALKTLAKNMIATMYKAQGIGLAANQVNVLQRIFVMDSSETGDNPLVCVNPVIIACAKTTQCFAEGCLSLPEKTVEKTRPSWVKIQYYDVSGIKHEKKFDDIEAVCVQHEMDHLNGILMIDA